MSKMRHPIRVDGYSGSLKELARAVGDMRYDKVAHFLRELSLDLKRQGEGDKKRKRLQLSTKLYSLADRLDEDALLMDDIMRLCARHMNEEELIEYKEKN